MRRDLSKSSSSQRESAHPSDTSVMMSSWKYCALRSVSRMASSNWAWSNWSADTSVLDDMDRGVREMAGIAKVRKVEEKNALGVRACWK